MKNFINEYNEDKNEIISNDYLHIVNSPTIINNYSVYLTDQISDGKYYRELLNIFRQVKEEDYINIYINNTGGDVDTSIDIINAMNTSLGNVIINITGPIYSVASLIALHGKKVRVYDNALMMFHDYSNSTIGKGNEQKIAINHEKHWFDNFFINTVNKFLTKKETRSVLKGIDLYLGENEIKDRLKKIGKLLD